MSPGSSRKLNMGAELNDTTNGEVDLYKINNKVVRLVNKTVWGKVGIRIQICIVWFSPKLWEMPNCLTSKALAKLSNKVGCKCSNSGKTLSNKTGLRQV